MKNQQKHTNRPMVVVVNKNHIRQGGWYAVFGGMTMNVYSYSLKHRIIRNVQTGLRRTHGFTLIELLVVVSIIALLVSILLPALAKAREHGQNIVCMTNMHNFGLSVFYYAEDNKDYLVPASLRIPASGSTAASIASFDTLLDGYLDKTLSDENGGMWHCLGDKIIRDKNFVTTAPRSYVINFYLSADHRYGSKSVKLSRAPSHVSIFGEYWSAYNGVRQVLGAANFFFGIFAVQLEAPLYGKYHFKRNANFFFTDLTVEGYPMTQMANSPNLAGNKYYWE